MIPKLLAALVESGRRFIAPSGEECAICRGLGTGSAAGLPLCRRCYGQLPWIAPDHIQCRRCGRYEACPDCDRRKDTHFICNRSAVRYDRAMKEWLGRFKYRGDERLQLLFSAMFVSLFRQFLPDQGLKSKDVAVLTYVPLSRERLEERGFNQAELFARGLGAAFGLPVLPLLDRTRHTGKQSFKTRSERFNDLRGVFAANRARLEQLPVGQRTEPAHIVLIDDVYTTGSTLNECARVITEALPSRVYGLTWAR